MLFMPVSSSPMMYRRTLHILRARISLGFRCLELAMPNIESSNDEFEDIELVAEDAANGSSSKISEEKPESTLDVETFRDEAVN